MGGVVGVFLSFKLFLSSGDLLHISLIVDVILISSPSCRYLTTTYGSGQDIDERIVEGNTVTNQKTLTSSHYQ